MPLGIKIQRFLQEQPCLLSSVKVFCHMFLWKGQLKGEKTRLEEGYNSL